MTQQINTLTEACAEMEENLVLFHYGDILGTERNTVQAHLENCAGCAGYLKHLSTLLPLTHQVDEPPRFLSTALGADGRNGRGLCARPYIYFGQRHMVEQRAGKGGCSHHGAFADGGELGVL